jgi:hypothetical protein
LADRDETKHAYATGPAGGRTRFPRRRRGGWRGASWSGERATASVRGQTNVRGVLRAAGRVLLWAFVGLIFVRGLIDVVGGQEKRAPSLPFSRAGVADAEMQSYAVVYARAYLTAGTTGAAPLRPLISDELAARGLPQRAGHGEVSIVQATVAGEQRLAAGRALITVACEVKGSAEPRYLVVPVARDLAGRLGVFAAPALVAGPQLGAVEPEEPLPVEGTAAPAIRELAQRFLAGYLSDEPASDFRYLVATSVRIAPAGPGLELIEVTDIGQLAAADGPRRSLLVDAWVRDRATRSIYPLTYRLELVRRDRWYVSSVGGGLW